MGGDDMDTLIEAVSTLAVAPVDRPIIPCEPTLMPDAGHEDALTRMDIDFYVVLEGLVPGVYTSWCVTAPNPARGHV